MELGHRPEILDRSIRALSDPGADHRTAIVAAIVVDEDLAYRVPVAGGEVCLEPLVYPCCRVFQRRCRPAEFLEFRDRGVEIYLVECLEAADEIALDRGDEGDSPLGGEAFLRGFLPDMGADAPTLVSRCTAST